MDNLKSTMEKAKEIMIKCKYYESALNLMHIDSDLGIPAKGEEYRNKSKGFFSGEISDLFKSKEAVHAAAALADRDPACFENPYEKALVRTFLHKYKYVAAVPKQQVSKINELTSKAMAVWKEAYDKSDYKLLCPYLKEIFERKTEIAQCIDNSRNPLDVIMNENQEYISLETVDGLFSQLKDEVMSLMERIVEKNAEINSAFLYEDIEEEKVAKACTNIVRKMGFDIEKGKIYKSMYSCCMPVGPRDVRINCDFHNFYTGIFALLHEAGHGIYDYSSGSKAVEYGLWGGLNGCFHEGQARFYENIIGRSREFWECFYKELQNEIVLYKNVNLEDFYKAINKTEASLIRVDADELTYNLHIILRFEMEKEYFENKIKVEDFADVINEKYRKYLNIMPACDREGILQDIHWAMGCVGYYQNYAMGNIYGGQLYEAMTISEPDIMKHIASGNFDTLKKWQYENIHNFSSVYTPYELLEKVTGKSLGVEGLTTYFKNKYSDIYGI